MGVNFGGDGLQGLVALSMRENQAHRSNLFGSRCYLNTEGASRFNCWTRFRSCWTKILLPPTDKLDVISHAYGRGYLRYAIYQELQCTFDLSHGSGRRCTHRT